MLGEFQRTQAAEIARMVADELEVILDPQPYLNAPKAAKFLGVPDAIFRTVIAPQIPSYHVTPRRLVYFKGDLREYPEGKKRLPRPRTRRR